MPNLLTQLFELLFYLVGPFLLVLLAFLFSTLLHELGHAVPVLLMTQGRVEIYIGSYGQPARSLKCRLGRLDVFLRYNPFTWSRGICKPPRETLSVSKRITYVATGPLVSLALGLTCWYLLKNVDFERPLQFFIALLLLASASHTLSTAIPMTYRAKTPDGRKRISDGAVILQLIKNRHLPDEFWRAAEQMRQKNFSEAAILMDSVLAAGYRHVEIYRLSIEAHLHLKNDATAINIFETYKKQHAFGADDYYVEAYVMFRTGRSEEALQSVQRVLKMDPNHVHALNLRGYTLSTMRRDTEALADFEKAISLSPEFAYCLCNRGWVKIKLGQLEEGLADVNHSLTLDPSNAYAYRNLGLYHLRKNEPGKAMELLQKAKEMDPTTHLADEYLAEAQAMKAELPAI